MPPFFDYFLLLASFFIRQPMLVLSSKKLAKIDEIKQAGRTGNLYSVEFSAAQKFL